jgi:hypothetical protein
VDICIVLNSIHVTYEYNLNNICNIIIQFNRTGQGSQCNQAILIITDGPFGPYKEVLQHNKPHMPIRVFTYLIGKDNSNAADMNWIACNNKGKF